MKSSTPSRHPCKTKRLSEMSVWPCHACTYTASFTCALASESEQTPDFSDRHPVLTKKNSYSWPCISDFALICAPTWIEGGSVPAPQSRIQPHHSCPSAFLSLYCVLAKHVSTRCSSFLFCPELLMPLASARGQIASTEFETPLNASLMLSLSLLRGWTQGVHFLHLPHPSLSVPGTPVTPQCFRKENGLWIQSSHW